MGGKYGTCFDISVLKEGDTYRMWLSWRPKKSIALVESTRRHPLERAAADRPRPAARIPAGKTTSTGPSSSSAATAITCGTPARPRAIRGSATPPAPMAGLEAHERPARARRRAAVGKSGRDVPARRSGTSRPTVPHVVLRRRAIRAERHRLRHQPRRPDLDQARGQPGLRARSAAAPGRSTRSPACQVEKRGDWYVMFYIGFRDEHHAQIGLARSQRRHHRLAAPSGQSDHSARARTSGTTTPATSRSRSSTAGSGCSGTTAGTAAWSRSAWCGTPAKTWGSTPCRPRPSSRRSCCPPLYPAHSMCRRRQRHTDCAGYMDRTFFPAGRNQPHETSHSRRVPGDPAPGRLQGKFRAAGGAGSHAFGRREAPPGGGRRPAAGGRRPAALRHMERANRLGTGRRRDRRKGTGRGQNPAGRRLDLFPGGDGPLGGTQAAGPGPRQLATRPRRPVDRLFRRPSLHEACWGSQPVALPLGSPVFCCYYRADWLEKLGRRPPQTWSEYLELARLLRDKTRPVAAATARWNRWAPAGPA